MDENEKIPQSLLPEVMNRLGLGHTSFPSLEVPAAEALKSPEWRVRVVALSALRERQDGASLALVLTALDDDDEAVRAMAIRTLTGWGKQMPVNCLILALQDPSWQVREAAVLALGTLGKQAPVEYLQTALHDENEFVHESAVMALQQTHPEALVLAAQGIRLMPVAAVEEHEQLQANSSSHNMLRTLVYALWPFFAKSRSEDGLEEHLYPESTGDSIPQSVAREQSSRQRAIWRVVEGLVAVLVVAAIIISWFALTHGLYGPGLGENDTYLGPPIWTYHNDNHTVDQINWTPDSKFLSFYGGVGDQIHLLNVTTKREKAYTMSDSNSMPVVSSAAFGGSSEGFSPNGQYVSIVDDYGQKPTLHVQVWNAETGQQLLNYTYIVPSISRDGPGVYWSNDSRRIAIGDNNGSVLIWDVVSKQKPFLLYGYNVNLDNIVWSQDGRHVAGSANRGTVEVWDVITKQRTFATLTSSAVNTLALSLDGSQVAVATSQKTIQIWNVATGKGPLIYQDAMNNIYIDIEWAQGNNHIVSVNANTDTQTQNIRIWDAATGRTLADIPSAYNVGWSLSPDGRYVVIEGPDKSTVQVWDTTTGKNIATHYGSSIPIGDLPTWSPDGRYIATVRSDDALQVWSVATGQNVYTYQGDAEMIMQIVWSPDGKYLATLSTQVTSFNSDSSFSFKGSSIKIWHAPH